MSAALALAPPAAPPPAKSSFYLGMRVLPRARREAMYRVYAFCRAVDDVADGDAGVPDPAAELEAWRADVASLWAGGPPGRAALLAAPARDYGLAREDAEAVIDGMLTDARGPVIAPSWDALDLYCDRVASAVGRLSNPVFGLEAALSRPLAHHLGRALQLTNVLRDLDEDAGLGRLYLPAEALDDAGIAARDPAAVLAHPALPAACAPVVARAREHFEEAALLLADAPRAPSRAPRLMAAAYAPVLGALERRGFAPPRRRVGVSKWRLALAALREVAR